VSERTAWIHCFSGVAGDMLLGALLDCGADVGEVRAIVARLGVDGWALDAEPTMRGGIACTRAVVDAPEHHHHRTWKTIRTMLDDAGLPPRVHARAHAAFEALAGAEGGLHRTDPDDVHFHEVGALDAIVDVVGVCAALEVLDVGTVVCSPVATGHGSVGAAHGSLPVPAPATLRLLEGVPVVGVDVGMELATPTGAALVRTLASSFGPLPAMTVERSGYGAGTRDLERGPNVVQVVLGAPVAGDLRPGQPVVLLEANVDDATGEVLAHAVAALLAAGAHDAWVTPIVMKKGRPAHTVSTLADPAATAAVAAVLTAETGSLGVRGTTLERWPSSRTVGTVVVDGHEIRVKVTPSGRVKVEHDDAAAAAAALGRPLRQVLVDAEAAARRP
jgi:uncharacterized protein (TIGR00299 family) protein